jgi:hypothetical protein
MPPVVGATPAKLIVASGAGSCGTFVAPNVVSAVLIEPSRESNPSSR